MFFEKAAETVAKAPSATGGAAATPVPTRHADRHAGCVHHHRRQRGAQGRRDPVSRTYRTLLVVIVAALAVGGYWKFALAPKRQEAAELEQQVIAAQTQLGQTRATIATYQDAQGAVQANRATVVRLGKAVPADDDTRSLVVQLDAAAKRSGIDFDNVDISAGTGAAASTAAGRRDPGHAGRGEPRQLLRDAVQLQLHRATTTTCRTSSRGSSAS